MSGKRKISRKEAGRCTLEALKPSPMEVVLTLNHGDLGGEILKAILGGSVTVFA